MCWQIKWTNIQVMHFIIKRHCMRELGSDGNLNVMFFKDFQIICLTHRSSFYMEFIRKHDEQVSTYTWFCLDLSCIASCGLVWYTGNDSKPCSPHVHSGPYLTRLLRSWFLKGTGLGPLDTFLNLGKNENQITVSILGQSKLINGNQS